jgi:hydrogenase maturation factor
MEINLDAIPVSPLAAKLCATYGLDPLGTIASGALLATCASGDAEHIVELWAQAGWSGTVIGRMGSHHNQNAEPVNGHITNPMTGRPQALTALRAGKRLAFPTFAADEIIKLWTS